MHGILFHRQWRTVALRSQWLAREDDAGWSVNQSATTLSINNGIGAVARSGSTTIATPAVTTTYTITATMGVDVATKTVTAFVNSAPINQTLGSVAASGGVRVVPMLTTTSGGAPSSDDGLRFNAYAITHGITDLTGLGDKDRDGLIYGTQTIATQDYMITRNPSP